MKQIIIFVFLFLCVNAPLRTSANSSTQTDKIYFEIPTPIKFNNNDFYFRFSANPNNGYYLQEYLLKGEPIDRFTQMFSVSILLSEKISTKEIAETKIYELEARKKTDAVCKYISYENNNEYIFPINILYISVIF